MRMRWHLMLFNLGSLLVLFACEQSLSAELLIAASSPEHASGNKQEPASATYKLYDGAKHSDNLPHVNHALDKHKKNVQAPLKPEEPKLDSPDTETSVKVPEPPLALNAEIEKKIVVESVPAQGVATPCQSTPYLKGQVQDYVAEWFRVPAWLAGTWWKDGDLTVSLIDLRNGKESFPNEWVENKMESIWGHQADASGQVWHVNLLPSERDGKSGNTKVRFLTNLQKCERSDRDTLVTRTHYIVSESSFLTGQPIDMFQQESLNHYFPTGVNQVMNVSSNRVFTYQGQPVRDGKLQSKLTKMAGFSPTAYLNGVDLKNSLNDFLQANDMGDLMNK